MKYNINELCIDKTSYSIYDQIKGYVEFTINSIEYKYDHKNIKNLELSIEFGALYKEFRKHTFISEKDILKEIQNIKENQIQKESFSFYYDLDLITSSGYQQYKYPAIKYYIKAIITNNNSQLVKIEIVFSIYRPFPQIVRQVQEQVTLPVESKFCFTYGQIQSKIEIDKIDFQMNDVANIKILLDLSLTSIDITQVDIHLISEDYLKSTNNFYNLIYQKITCNVQQSNHLYSIQQQLSIKCSEAQYKEFYSSTECQGFAHQYYIQLRILFGCFVRPIIIQLSIILYQTQTEHLNLFMKSQMIKNEVFNQEYFEQIKKVNQFIKTKIKQKEWNNRMIDFQKIDNNQHQDLAYNTIMVQQSQIK